MKIIRLYGYLKEQFGAEFRVDVNSPQQAISFLVRQVKGFKEAVKPGTFTIFRGDLKNKKTVRNIDEQETLIRFGKDQELHIIPIVSGAGSGFRNALKIINGIAFIGVGLLFAAAGLAPVGLAFISIGVGLIAQGTAGLLTPAQRVTPTAYDSREPADQRTSFLFNGAVNKTEQGGPVPLVYGRIRAGSVVVSAGLSAEAIL
ncbi:MAG: hypothetical protein ABFD50_08125 [Smithella sp.]